MIEGDGDSTLRAFSGRGEDERFMRLALAEAERALELGETPVGAIVVGEGRILARGHNRVETLRDPTAHAEILALGAAAESLGDWRLQGLTLYVTMEPCIMCAGSLLLARMGRLVYGVRDQRAGACGSSLDVLQANPYSHEMRVTDGCLEEECRALLQAFYRALRKEDPHSP